MKKVLGAIAGIIFFAFCVGVIGLLISLTYSALGKLFPGSFENQMWGLVLFDVATIAWALAFAFRSSSLGQYAAAGVGFLVGLAGTIAMVAFEVIISSAGLTGNTDGQKIGQWMVYAFIGATILHVILIYMHHAASPDMSKQISVGVARAEVTDKAIQDAVKQLDVEKAALAQAITLDIVSQVKRDLQLTPVDDTIFDRRKYQADAEDATAKERPLSQRFTDWVNKRRPRRSPTLEQIAQTSDALMAWQETPSGRRRLWCKVCRDQGADWLTDGPCQHVQEAEPGEKISAEAAMAMLRDLMREPQPSQSQ